MDSRNCHIHADTVITPQDAECPYCLAMLECLPDPKTMTPDQREAEVRMWLGTLEIEFSKVHKRLEALCDAPMWTHFMANMPLVIEIARDW